MSYNPLYVGSMALGSARQTQTSYTNGTGSTMPVGTAVSTNNAGNIVLLDVTNESTVESWVGLTSQAIPSTALGTVISDGRIPNVNSLGFSVGEPVWVGVSPGSLTNVKPDLTAPGWASGYFVIFVGVVVQNEFVNTQQDIQLCRQIIGEL